MKKNNESVKLGYKMTPLGLIPEDWEVKRLRDICIKLVNGGTPSTSVKEFWDGPIPWITGADIIEGKITIRKQITESALRASSTNIVPEGNLLIVSRTGVGKIAITNFDLAISQDLTGLLINERIVNLQFLFQKMNFSSAKLKKLNQGTSINGITRSVLESIQISIPPLSEQKAIAKILSTWDEAIDKTRQLIEQKELRKKALMQQLLTGKKRLKGFTGEWREVRLGEVFSERNETNTNGLPLLTIAQDGIYPQSESQKRDISNKDKSSYKRINIGDIGYNTMRMWQGRCALSFVDGIVSPAYTVITPLEGHSGAFYALLFTLPETIYKFYQHSQGLVSDTLNCKFPDFAKIKVNVPQLSEQLKISTFFDTLDTEINLIKLQFGQLKLQKKALMQVLLTGRRRVNYECN